jgi:hypothetical protein
MMQPQHPTNHLTSPAQILHLVNQVLRFKPPTLGTVGKLRSFQQALNLDKIITDKK